MKFEIWLQRGVGGGGGGGEREKRRWKFTGTRADENVIITLGLFSPAGRSFKVGCRPVIASHTDNLDASDRAICEMRMCGFCLYYGDLRGNNSCYQV